jgi:hypothetical protein
MSASGRADEQDPGRLLRHVLDRQEILDCLVRYTRGIDRLDRELVLSAYHPDAIDDHGVFAGRPDEFFDWVCSIEADPRAVKQLHRITNHSCEIDGDVAHAETYYMASTVRPGSDKVRISSGRYIDRLERRAGAWKIAMRYCVTDWIGTMDSVPIPFADNPDAHVNGVAARGPEDPSYRRPLTNRRPTPA